MYPGDTIHIFDAGRDRFVKIEYKDALKRNLAAYAGGNPESGEQLDLSELYQLVVDSRVTAADGKTNMTVPDLAKLLKDLNKSNIESASIAPGTEATKDELLKVFPTLLLLRPFQTWRMAR